MRAIKAGTVALAVALAATLAMTGCSAEGGAATPPGSSSAPNAKVNIAYVAYNGTAATLLGVKEGIFKKAGVDVTGQVAASPAAIIAGLVNGELNIGFTTIITLVAAVEKGIPIKCIASADGVGNPDPSLHNNGLVVSGDSPIKSADELNGKKVGVLALGSLNHLVATDIIAQAGGDPTTVDFVQLPFPQVADALAKHQVDGAIITEPFTTPLLAAGARGLGWAEAPGGLMSDRTTKCYAATTDYIAKNPKVVEAFVKGQNASLTYAQEHQKDALATLHEILSITPEQAAGLKTGVIFRPGIKTEDVEYIQDLMLKYKWITKSLPVTDYLYEPAK
jgi:NitT/TauT family transport system substrate-binding protein